MRSPARYKRALPGVSIRHDDMVERHRENLLPLTRLSGFGARMNLWKTLLAILLLAGALWFLSPSRAINDEPGVVEISYLADDGPNTDAVAKVAMK